MPKKLLGSTTPRLWTPPLRPLNRRTSLGYEAADFAQITGEPLLPWQRWAAIHALELNPDGTFRFRIILIIVARQQGKSHLKRNISLWRMFMQPGAQILGVAQEVKLARRQWNFCQSAIHAAPDLEAEWGGTRGTIGDEYFWLANGSVYAIGAANRKSGRGSSNDELTIDELREMRTWDPWAALSKTTMARENSQILCMSNAGDDGSVVLNGLRDTALSGRDPTIGIFEWSGEDGCELDDWNAIRQANPGLGYNTSAAAIRSALHTDPPDVFRTEVLCQRVQNLDGAIDMIAWKDCADAAGTMDGLRDRLAVVFDVAPDSRHATLAVAGLLSDGRPRGELVKAWKTTDEARAELPELVGRVKPRAFGWFPGGPGAGMATTLRPLAESINRRLGKQRGDTIPEDGAIAGTRVSEACMELADLVKARAVLHPDDPLLNAHIGGASKLVSGDGWRFTRKGGPEQGHVDAAYAFAGAVRLAKTLPEPPRTRLRFIS